MFFMRTFLFTKVKEREGMAAVRIKLMPVKSIPTRQMPKEKCDKRIADFAESNQQVCKITGVSYPTLRRIIRDLGLHTKIWVAQRGGKFYIFKRESGAKSKRRKKQEE